MMDTSTAIRDGLDESSGLRAPARILLVTHGYPPHQTGGAEIQAQRKARWWARRGDEVRVLAADTGAATAPPFGVVERAEDSDGAISICRLRFQAPDGTRPFDETFLNRLLEPDIEREMSTFQPDLVYQVSGYLFGLIPLERAAAHGVPSVLFAMDFWHECPRLTLLRPDGTCCPGSRHPADCAACRLADRAVIQRLPLLSNASWGLLAAAGRLSLVGNRLDVPVFTARQAVVGSALVGVALVVVNSRFLAGRLRCLGVPDDRMLVIRQGIDIDDVPDIRSERPAGGPLRVLYLGQITRHKGVDLAAQAVHELADRGHAIHLRVHGQPTGDAAYIQQIAALGESSVIDVGDALGRRELMQALRDSDVLVVPSRWYENSPNVILEAFAAGVPVIVADHGGMAEMVRDGIDGLRFLAGDASSLAGVLQRLCDEPGLLARLRAGITPPGSVDDEMRAEEAALIRILGVRR